MLTTLLARATFAVSAWLARAEESSAAASLARRRSERREAAEELRDANARLVARAAVVQHLETNARYFSLLEPGELDPAAELWLLARNSAPDDVHACDGTCHSPMWARSTVDALASDARALGGGGGGGEAPINLTSDNDLAHNLAFARLADGRVVAAGGQDNDPVARRGIHVFAARSRAEVLARGWLARARALSVVPGDHPGCVEARLDQAAKRRALPARAAEPPYRCRFDGKLSLVAFRGRLFLYARANVAPVGGGRLVQVTSAPGPEGPWDRFTLVTIAGFPAEPLERRPRAHDSAGLDARNVYFAAVSANPADNRTVLGLFPVLLNTAAAVSLALSCDGVAFSRLTRLVRSRESVISGHTTDQPVDGIVRRGDDVYFYVHRGVRGIRSWEPAGRPRLTRLTVPFATLARYTADARASLARAGLCEGPAT